MSSHISLCVLYFGDSCLKEFPFKFKAIRPLFLYISWPYVSPWYCLSHGSFFSVCTAMIYPRYMESVESIKPIFVLFSVNSNVSFRSCNATLQVVLTLKVYLHSLNYTILLLLSPFGIIRPGKELCLYPLHFTQYNYC